MGIARDIFEICDQGLMDLEDSFLKRFDDADKNASSLSRKAADGTLQFPLLISRAISFETAQKIAKATEVNAASFAQIVLTMNPDMDTSNDKGAAEYIRRFHTNADTTDDVFGQAVHFVNSRDATNESYILTQIYVTSDAGLRVVKEELDEYGIEWRSGSLNSVVAAKYAKDNVFRREYTPSEIHRIVQEKLESVMLESKRKKEHRHNDYDLERGIIITGVPDEKMYGGTVPESLVAKHNIDVSDFNRVSSDEYRQMYGAPNDYEDEKKNFYKTVLDYTGESPDEDEDNTPPVPPPEESEPNEQPPEVQQPHAEENPEPPKENDDGTQPPEVNNDPLSERPVERVTPKQTPRPERKRQESHGERQDKPKAKEQKTQNQHQPNYTFNARILQEKERDPHEIAPGRQVVMRDLLKDNDVKKSNELAPILLHIKVIARDKSKKSDGGAYYVDFVIGVKATMHPINSEEMVTEITNACRYHDELFRFIRWTTGEISFFKDFLLNLKDSREAVSHEQGGGSPWWNRLHRMRVIANFKARVFMKNRLLPNASIAITQQEVDYIKNTFGFNLMEPRFAEDVMNRYYLLCFIVVDESLEIVHFKYDGQKSYQTLSFSGLQKENSDAARQFRDILKAVGRV